MILKYKRASLYTVVMVPQICYIQSIKFCCFYLLYQLLLQKCCRTNHSNLNHLLSQQSFVLISIQGSCGLAAHSWARLGSSAAHGWAGLGWSRLGLAGSGYTRLVSSSLPRTGGLAWACFSHGYCRAARQHVDTQRLLITKLRTGTPAIGQSKSQGQTQGRRWGRMPHPERKGTTKAQYKEVREGSEGLYRGGNNTIKHARWIALQWAPSHHLHCHHPSHHPLEPRQHSGLLEPSLFSLQATGWSNLIIWLSDFKLSRGLPLCS